MIQANQKRFEELIAEMVELFTDTTAFVKITITGIHTELKEESFDPEQLKKLNISIRNVKGDLIKHAVHEDPGLLQSS